MADNEQQWSTGQTASTFASYSNQHPFSFDECCSMAFYQNRATTECRDTDFSSLIEANSH